MLKADMELKKPEQLHDDIRKSLIQLKESLKGYEQTTHHIVMANKPTIERVLTWVIMCNKWPTPYNIGTLSQYLDEYLSDA